MKPLLYQGNEWTMLISDQRKIKKYYNALVARDERFIGVFFVGVKTTGIFCISTCRARKPKFDNVKFFDCVEDLIQDGYRPCKICKPTANAEEAPTDVKKAIQMLEASERNKVSDQALKKAGVSPEKIRRWFNKHYGITFQVYQRMSRVNAAHLDLKDGKSVSDSAYSSGYESLSGFSHSYKKIVGISPEESKDMIIIQTTRLTTPLGPMIAASTEKGICLLEFADRTALTSEIEDLKKRLNAQVLSGDNQHLQQLRIELKEYFDGMRQVFEVSLDTPTTPFRQQVWDLLLEIPFGQTISYLEHAKKLGNPKAIRAVASANGQNRIAIVIPCHRVIGSDGSLTGYAGGLERKKWLLEMEGSIEKSSQISLF